MCQGGPLHRAQLPPRTGAAATQAQRPKGQRTVCTRELGRRAERYRGAAAGHHGARWRRSTGHPALQLCRHHGPGAARQHVLTIFPPTRRLFVATHHLCIGWRRGTGAHPGRQARHAGGVFCAIQADPDLGQQLHHQQPAFLALCPGGQAPGRQAGMYRSAAQRDGRKMP